MGTVIGEQARTLAASVLLGMALALLYDLLRALRARRRSRVLTAVLDAVYCLVLALSALAFPLRLGGGETRLYTLLAAALGAAAFFALLSPALRPLWDFWAQTVFALLRLLSLPVRLLESFLTNLHKTAKRLFLFCRRSVIITRYRKIAVRMRRRARRREAARRGKAEKTTEKARQLSRRGARHAAAVPGDLAAGVDAWEARRGAGGTGRAG